MTIDAQVPIGNPQAHFRITPNDDNARALLPTLLAFPFNVADAVLQVIRIPIPVGAFVRGVLVKFSTAFDAASVNVGDAANASGFIISGACTAGVINSFDVASLAAFSAVGGKYYSSAGVLTLTFADPITVGEGTLFVDVFEVG